MPRAVGVYPMVEDYNSVDRYRRFAAGLEKRDNAAELTEEEVDEMVGGNLCRCTGYANIKKAVHHANATMRDGTR